MADFGKPSAKIVTDLSDERATDNQEAEIDRILNTTDMSLGHVRRDLEVKTGSLLNLDQQKLQQRSWFFFTAMLACAVMSGAFLYFAYKVLCIVESNGGIVPDWHLLLLGSGLIIPPTVILFGLMRQVYKVEASRDEAPDSGETYPVFHALLSALKDVFQK